MVKAAVVQLCSGAEVDSNLATAAELLREAAAQGARLALLPENFAFMGRHENDKLAIAEATGAGPIQDWLAMQARQHGLWLLGGSIPLRSPDGRVFASLLVMDPQGQCRARYDKIHLFDVDLPGGEQYRESRTIAPGRRAAAVATPWGRVGLSICYDLRFPELYRSYAGAEFLAVPSAFTAQTGAAHWEPLLRARAIENQAFVLAADQGGRHANGRETYGGSMIVDPWGQVLVRLDQHPGVLVAECDLHRQQAQRRSLPVWQHRRL
ncbi:MAG: carbon-nitrogen hydrolase family protein [Acidithiobacillus sp.]|uniref:carbon-nitrogen hydrolase family protein n=1 Tax=Acidithiobacillus sp. TaxID=1872118 RepID=UPI003D013875